MPDPSHDPYFATFSVAIAELAAFPQPQTLTEAVLLRDDVRMKDLREVLLRWTETAREEQGAQTDRAVKEIRAASRALRRAKYCGAIAELVTYISLPIAVASASVPFAAGLAIAATGAVAQLHSRISLRSNRWLFVGQ